MEAELLTTDDTDGPDIWSKQKRETIGRVGWPSRPHAEINKAPARWASGPYRM